MNGLDRQSDAYLLGSFANGDTDAVRPLIERYQRPLVAVLRRAFAGGEVDDLAQETWIRVMRSAARYDPVYPFTSWLFTIAWNLVRSEWARAKPSADVDLGSLVSSSRSAEEEAIAVDRACRIRKLVTSLPEPMARTIFLRFFEELSEKEVASRLGVPVGTVKSRIHNALDRLAEAWEE